MIKVNDNFTLLSPSYLFSEIAAKVSDYRNAHPDAPVIRMGIGDVTRPICPAAIKALHEAVEHEAESATFHGYGPEQGYDFLREAIAFGDYNSRGVDISPDEIFISDGAKSDTGNIGDILSPESVVAVTDPVYPVYVDTNVMAGRAGSKLSDGRFSRIEYLPCTAENHFCPALPLHSPDIIYLCLPNNPTGTSITREQLKPWVDYALSHKALILFDAAYEAYISRPEVPHSIYEIEGAKECAIEFRSFSKTAGFTGLRCGFTVVPRQLKGHDSAGNDVGLHGLWLRRQSTKFNGASYPIQRAALALYSPEGREQVKQTIDYYKENARMLLSGLAALGFEAFGGVDSPYIWVKSPDGLNSWDFFDRLLTECNIVGTPGSGFGPSGEGYLRLTAFSSHEATAEATQRLKSFQ